VAYELWSTAPGNLLATYETQDAALAAVRALVASQGEAAGRELALLFENRRGQSRTIAVGDGLLSLARTSSPALS
jgi:hypothetical protein